jgi:NADPH2:quinone reductase
MTNEAIAARLYEHGKPLKVETAPVAQPGPGEVTVELSFASVNPIDRYIALGRVAADGPLPRTIGSEAAGHFGGKPVLVIGEGLGTARDGTFAGAVTCPLDAVVEASPRTDIRELAAIGIAGLTAWNVVTRSASVASGDRVLVLGAGGGVGISIVSLAASIGAEVWGQVGDAAKAGAVREAGAARVVVGGAGELAEAATLAPTVVFDPLGGPFTTAALSVLARRGTLVSFGTSAGADVSFNMQSVYRNTQRIVGYGGTALSTQERRSGLREAVQAFEEGRLRVKVDRVLPLAEVNEAFALLADRKVTGKLLLALS